MVSAEDMVARLPQAVGALDQPSMDGINTYFVSWAARQAGLKVALSGLGGDEVFGGYPTFRMTPRVAAAAGLARCAPVVAAPGHVQVAGGHRPQWAKVLAHRRIA